MDDYINALMLKTVLSIDVASIDIKTNIEHIKNINELNSAKSALNSILKYVDSN